MARTLRAAPSGAADWHPHAGRRFAPPIMRLERTGGPASKLAVPPAAHPPPPFGDGLGSMTAGPHDARQAVASGLRRPLTVGTIAGYVIFIVGTLLVTWLAWSQRSHEEKPAVILLIAWLVAGTTHSFVRNLWRACKFSAFGSVLVYIVLVVFMNAVNEMFVAGMILVGLFGYALALLMGIPVSMYRRMRDERARERLAEDGRGWRYGR